MQPDRKHPAGACPYCGSMNFSEGAERRPGQRVDKCNSCDKHSVLNARNGARYPLQNPIDPTSTPHV